MPSAPIPSPGGEGRVRASSITHHSFFFETRTIALRIVNNQQLHLCQALRFPLPGGEGRVRAISKNSPFILFRGVTANPENCLIEYAGQILSSLRIITPALGLPCNTAFNHRTAPLPGWTIRHLLLSRNHSICFRTLFGGGRPFNQPLL
jgi:hypothetical protein